jgi:antitoxin (DNA-binding transcriptional repressor) of toxin-antitoxin stability system
MRTIQVSEFEENCLALVAEVARGGETLLIVQNGRPVVELRPYSGGREKSPFGLHPELQIKGDILNPIDEDAWKAIK